MAKSGIAFNKAKPVRFRACLPENAFYPALLTKSRLRSRRRWGERARPHRHDRRYPEREDDGKRGPHGYDVARRSRAASGTSRSTPRACCSARSFTPPTCRSPASWRDRLYRAFARRRRGHARGPARPARSRAHDHPRLLDNRRRQGRANIQT
jgi:hypothetical protein